MAEYDVDGSETIDFEEFVKLAEEYREAETLRPEKMLEDAFA